MARLNLSETDIVTFVNDKVEAARQTRAYQRIQDNFAKWWRAYHGKFKNKSIESFKSRVFVNATFAFVEAIKSSIRFQIQNSRDLLLVSSTDADPRMKKRAELMTKLMNYYKDNTDVLERMADVLLYALKYGSCPVTTGWDFKVQEIRNRTFRDDPSLGIVEDKEELQEVIARDNPMINPWDPRDLLWDPRAKWNSDAQYLVYRERTTVHQLMIEAEEKEYINVDLVEKLARTTTGTQFNFGFDGRIDDGDFFGSQANANVTDHNRREIVIWHFWGIVDHTKQPVSNTIFNLAIIENLNIVVKAVQSPFPHGLIPGMNATVINVEDTIHGVGIVEKIFDEQQMINFLTNTRNDGIAHFINPRYLMWRGALKDKNAMDKTSPGKIIEVNRSVDLNAGVKPLIVPDAGAGSFAQAVAGALQSMERTAAFSSNQLGLQNPSERSATEVKASSFGSQARSDEMSSTFTQSFLKPMAQHWLALAQANVTSPVTVAITKEELVEIQPWMMQGRFDVTVHPPNIMNREFIAQVLGSTLAALAPFAQTGAIDPIPLITAIFKNNPVFDNMDVESIVRRPEVQNVLQGGGGGGAPGQQNQPGIATRQPAAVGGPQ